MCEGKPVQICSLNRSFFPKSTFLHCSSVIQISNDMASSSFYTLIALLFIVATFLLTRRSRSKRPPGPNGLPILGNIKDLPNPKIKPEWLHWHDHKEAYGPISSITCFGQTFVILNSAELTQTLFRDRAAIYSGRPFQHFSDRMVGWGTTVGMKNADDTWKQHRKNMAKIASSSSTIKVFDRIQEEEAAHFLLNVLESPDQLSAHVHTETAAVVARVVYGYTPASHGHDPMLELVGKVMDDLAVAAVPVSKASDIDSCEAKAD